MATNTDLEVGHFLRVLRERTPGPTGRPLSLRLAAKDATVNFAQIHRFEVGLRRPSPQQALLLAKAYHVEPLLVLRRLGYVPMAGFVPQLDVADMTTASDAAVTAALREFLDEAPLEAKRRVLALIIANELMEQLLPPRPASA